MPMLRAVLSGAMLTAAILAAQAGGWIDKSYGQWSDADARQVLADSPWARPTTATVTRRLTEDELREGGQLGQPRGIGYDGVDPAGSGPSVSARILTGAGGGDRSARSLPRAIRLTVVWESALPVRLAKVKLHAPEFTSLEGDGYRIAVYGIPDGDDRGDPQVLGRPLRDLAAFKRQGQKDVRPVAVEVYKMEDGPVVLYRFPVSAEIGRNEGQVEFAAQIGRIVIRQTFRLDEMRYRGKLAL